MPQPRGRHVVSLVIALVILFAPLCFWGLDAASVEAPLWLQGSLADWLTGNTPTIEWPETPEEAAEEFEEGVLQTTIEDALSEQVPLRAEAMLANAELQRTTIRASNLAFRWPAIPCFYGADYFYLTRYDALTTVKDTSLLDGWQRFGDEFSAFARRFPDVEFRAYVATEMLGEHVNDALSLMSNSVSATDLGEILQTATANDPNVQVLLEDYESGDEFYEDYFRGDNHWKGATAVRAYNRIAETLGLDALVTGQETPYPIPYLGSSARLGLYWLPDEAVDLGNDFSSLTVETENATRNGNDHSAYETADPIIQLIGYYGWYFSWNFKSVENLAKDDGSTALLLHDSFGAAILKPLATGFQHVYPLKWFSGESSGEETLAEEIERTGAATVVFVATPTDYSEVLGRHPNLFR